MNVDSGGEKNVLRAEKRFSFSMFSFTKSALWCILLSFILLFSWVLTLSGIQASSLHPLIIRENGREPLPANLPLLPVRELP